MILTVANQKGGVGKTTFVVNLANYLVLKGKKVLVVDTDVQANASYALSENESFETVELFKEISTILAAKISNNKLCIATASSELLDEDELDEVIFKENLKELNEKFDFIIIDTAPVINNKLIVCLEISNKVITPIELEIFSIQGLELMVNTILNIKKVYNKELDFVGVLPCRVNTQNKRQKMILDKLKEDYGSNMFLPFIRNRNDIANAIYSNLNFFETRSKHKKELGEVFDFVLNKMGVR